MRNIEQPKKIAIFVVMLVLSTVASMQTIAALDTGISGDGSLKINLSNEGNISPNSVNVNAESNSNMNTNAKAQLQENSLKKDEKAQAKGGDDGIHLFVAIGDRIDDIKEIIVNLIVRFKTNETVTINETIPANNTNVTLPVENNQTGNNTNNTNQPVNNTNVTIPGNLTNVTNETLNGTNVSITTNGTNQTIPGNVTNSTNSTVNSTGPTGISVEIDRGVGWAMNENGDGNLARFAGVEQFFTYSDEDNVSTDIGHSGLGIIEFNGQVYKLKLNATNNTLEITKTFDIIGVNESDEGDLVLTKKFSAGNFGTWTGKFLSTSNSANYTLGLAIIERNIDVSTQNGARMSSSNVLDIQNKNAEFQTEFNRIAEARIEIEG